MELMWFSTKKEKAKCVEYACSERDVNGDNEQNSCHLGVDVCVAYFSSERAREDKRFAFNAHSCDFDDETLSKANDSICQATSSYTSQIILSLSIFCLISFSVDSWKLHGVARIWVNSSGLLIVVFMLVLSVIHLGKNSSRYLEKVHFKLLLRFISMPLLEDISYWFIGSVWCVIFLLCILSEKIHVKQFII